MRQNLEFRGSSTVFFGDMLLLALLSTITFGLYFPWGYARLRRRALENTYYHDRPLQFDGSGGQLFGVWLKSLLLTIITLGIYGLLCFPVVAVAKWDAEHTVLPNGRRLEYRGTALDLFGQVLIVSLLSIITLGIYAFWGYARIRKHILTSMFVEGQPLQFTGTGGQYFGIAIVNFLLTTITLGIYALLGCTYVRELRWEAENTILPVLPEAPAATGQTAGGRPIQVTVNVNQ